MKDLKMINNRIKTVFDPEYFVENQAYEVTTDLKGGIATIHCLLIKYRPLSLVFVTYMKEEETRILITLEDFKDIDSCTMIKRLIPDGDEE
jgi:hypothetical protein